MGWKKMLPHMKKKFCKPLVHYMLVYYTSHMLHGEWYFMTPRHHRGNFLGGDWIYNVLLIT